MGGMPEDRDETSTATVVLRSIGTGVMILALIAIGIAARTGWLFHMYR